jgi:hypothetical protein
VLILSLWPGLIDDLYETALVPERSQPLWARMASRFHAIALSFGITDLEGGTELLPWLCVGISHAQKSVIHTRFILAQDSDNPYLQQAHRVAAGKAVRMEEIVPLKVLQPPRLYQEAMLPSGASHIGAAINLSEQGTFGALAMQDGDSDFSERSRAWMRRTEETLDANRLPAVGALASLRAMVISAERGSLPPGTVMTGAVSPRKARDAAAAEALRRSEELVSGVLRADLIFLGLGDGGGRRALGHFR